MKPRLSERQYQILDHIRACVAAEGRMPQLNKVAEKFGVTPATMAYHMRKLRENGLLKATPPSKLLPSSELYACSRESCFRRIKVIAAGIQAEPEKERFVLAPDEAVDICDPSEMTACEITDDSMFDIGIHCGDILIGIPVKYLEPQSGDVVIVRTADGEILVRSLLPCSEARAEFVPANKNFAARQVKLKNCEILGVVVSMIRHF